MIGILGVPAGTKHGLRLHLDVDIEAQELELALDSTKCRCLDGLDFGIGNKLQYQGVFASDCAHSTLARNTEA